MALRLTARLILAAAILAATSAQARAQSLQRLWVQSFVLSSDTDRPRVDVPFHLVVTLRVRERVTQIQNIELPMLAQLELLGDERQTIAGSGGTQYRESITVVAHDGGAIALSPATLQARDARDGKPKQWFTNGLTLQAGGIAPQAIRNGAAAAFSVLAAAVRVLFAMLALACVAGIAILIARRRPPALEAPQQMAAVTVARPRSLRGQIEDALVVLRADPSRATAARVRSALWGTIGAPEGETLGDVLRRRGASQPPLRDVLIALERSAFTYDADVSAATADACAALERYAESLA